MSRFTSERVEALVPVPVMRRQHPTDQLLVPSAVEVPKTQRPWDLLQARQFLQAMFNFGPEGFTGSTFFNLFRTHRDSIASQDGAQSDGLTLDEIRRLTNATYLQLNELRRCIQGGIDCGVLETKFGLHDKLFYHISRNTTVSDDIICDQQPLTDDARAYLNKKLPPPFKEGVTVYSLLKFLDEGHTTTEIYSETSFFEGVVNNYQSIISLVEHIISESKEHGIILERDLPTSWQYHQQRRGYMLVSGALSL